MSVTDANIRSLLDLPSSDTTSFSLQIAAANQIITDDFASSTHSTGRLDVIEQYLAAHFATLSIEHGGLSRKSMGESLEQYQLVSGNNLGYMSTRFGQQAVALDSEGILAQSVNANLKSEFRVI